MKKTDETLAVTFPVSDPETAGLVVPDELPIGELRINGEATADVVTVTAKSTGKYKAAVTLPTIADGDLIEIWVDALVGGVPGGGVVYRGDGVTKRPADVFAALPSAPLTAQQTRDALKLAPTAGVPAAGSVDKHLEDLLEDTGTTLPALIAGLAVVPLASGGSAPAAGTLTIRRGDTVSLTVEGLGSLAGRTELWWGGKKSTDDADEDALAIVEETAGLLICDGVDAADLDAEQTGTITVDDEAAGDITITLSAAATAALPVRSTAYWDVQLRTASGVTTLAAGALVVSADVVRAVE